MKSCLSRRKWLYSQRALEKGHMRWALTSPNHHLEDKTSHATKAIRASRHVRRRFYEAFEVCGEPWWCVEIVCAFFLCRINFKTYKTIAKIYTTTSKLNLRSAASFNGSITTVIPKNATVICYGYHTGDWYYVTYDKYTGFCNSKWLK